MIKANNSTVYGIFPEDYSVIRELLRICFLYGCFTGADISRGTYFLPQRNQGGSVIRKSTYSTRLKQLQMLFPDTFLRKSAGKLKIYSISTDLYDSMDDALLKSYKVRAFTTGQFMNYFLILLASQKIIEESDNEEVAFSAKSIASVIIDAYDSAKDVTEDIPQPFLKECEALESDKSGQVFDILKTHINALLGDGVLQNADEYAPLSVYDKPLFDDEARFQNNRLFSLAPDFLGELKPMTLQHLFDHLDHCSKSASIRLPYYLAKCRIRLYCNTHDVPLQKKYAIKYRHNYLFGILDEEVELQLLHAIQDHSAVRIEHKYDEFKYGKDDSFHKIDTDEVIPSHIIQDADSGRSYLACYSFQTKKAMVLRLDLILDVEQLEKPDECTLSIASSACSLLNNAWCASPVNYEQQHEIHLHFHAPSQKRYLADDIMRRFQPSQIKKTNSKDGFIELFITAVVSDPIEMIPWIRSMGRYLTVVQDTEDGKKLFAAVQDSFTKMLQKYEFEE